MIDRVSKPDEFSHSFLTRQGRPFSWVHPAHVESRTHLAEVDPPNRVTDPWLWRAHACFMNCAVPSESLRHLAHIARTTRIPWLIEGIWQSEGIAVIHSLEEEFKSVLSFQIAEAIATSVPLLDLWKVPQQLTTGYLNTEMSDLSVGKRVVSMFPDDSFPGKLAVSTDADFRDEYRRASDFGTKLACVEAWIKSYGIEVLIWDTINSILASIGNPNNETTMSKFLEKVSLLPLKGLQVVRHDGKPSAENRDRAPNQRVRGSNRLVEDSSLVIGLKRTDKAAHKVLMTVGKLRDGSKPDPLELWFDLATFRLVPKLPVVAILENGPLCREDLIKQASERFKLSERTTDEQIRKLFAEPDMLSESRVGHKRVLALQDGPKDRLINWCRPLSSGHLKNRSG